MVRLRAFPFAACVKNRIGIYNSAGSGVMLNEAWDKICRVYDPGRSTDNDGSLLDSLLYVNQQTHVDNVITFANS